MKDDTVSRAAVLKAIDDYERLSAVSQTVRNMTSLREVVKWLPAVPSEIIRCRDCEHYKFADNRAFGFPVKHCEVTGFEDVDDYDFCSNAERREHDTPH